MTDFPYAIVGFDLDGTLVDSAGDIAAAANRVMLETGRPALPVPVMTSFIGNGSRVLLERALEQTGGGLPKPEVDAMLGAFMRYYAADLAVHTRPYPGCIAMLDELASLGCTLAVVTNKFEKFAQSLLEQLGLADRFATIIGGDTLGRGRSKPAPDPIFEMMSRCGGGKTVFIGDTTTDVKAAKAANVPCLAVSFGFNDRPPHKLGADTVIDHFDQLVGTLRHK